MIIDFMKDVFVQNHDKDAIVWRDSVFSYRWLTHQLRNWEQELNEMDIAPGSVVTLEGDFSPNSIALFLALIERGILLVPLTEAMAANKDEFKAIAQTEVSFVIDSEDNISVEKLPHVANHDIYDRLRRINHPGLVLFSSGSTGQSKAAVHDLTKLLEKFKVTRRARRTISFLLFDHIGGVNTMLYTLSNGGCLVAVETRDPDSVLGAVEKYNVDLLPTSPTFINLVLLSEAYKRHDLSSLKMITYGTEPMPESTLKRFHQLFPAIELLQTYGLSEVGILRSKSRASDSLWVKIGGEGFETRVVDGILHIKAQSSVLGYLNAPSPIGEDGWLNTGDAVEVDGEYIKILGRESEIINVGGEKVYPAEVESVIQEMQNVSEVTVYGEKNPITGNIVCARISLVEDRDRKSFTMELKRHCGNRLQRYKVPVKISIEQRKQHSARFKKMRQLGNVG